jgi:hypothetical protein
MNCGTIPKLKQSDTLGACRRLIGWLGLEPPPNGEIMITREDILKLVDEDNDFFEVAYKYYVGHIDYKRWHNPEYDEEFDSDFILRHWDKIAHFMRGRL